MHRNEDIWQTVYLRDTTVADFEETLQGLGAVRASKNLDGWRWRFPANGDVVVEVQVLENIDGWQMELVIESLNKWRAPFAGLGWEPTIAAMLRCDGSPTAVNATSTVVHGIFARHPGVTG